MIARTGYHMLITERGPDHDLQHLLDLHMETIEVGHGYWVSIRAREVPPDEGRPHGISYALTLHGPRGRRLIGYDNAHAPPVTSSGPSRRSRQKSTFDHVHKDKAVQPYEFNSAERLLIDFWTDVYAALAKEGVS